jgi:hypothetical protein
MAVFPDQHRPMLRRVRIFIRLLGNEFTELRLFREPLAGETADGMPSDFHQAKVSMDIGFGSLRNDVGFGTQADGVFEREF